MREFSPLFVSFLSLMLGGLVMFGGISLGLLIGAVGTLIGRTFARAAK